MNIDENKMREEVEGCIKAEIEGSIFETNVIEMVWGELFVNTVLTAEDHTAATKMFKPIFKEYLTRMLNILG